MEALWKSRESSKIKRKFCFSICLYIVDTVSAHMYNVSVDTVSIYVYNAIIDTASI